MLSKVFNVYLNKETLDGYRSANEEVNEVNEYGRYYRDSSK